MAQRRGWREKSGGVAGSEGAGGVGGACSGDDAAAASAEAWAAASFSAATRFSSAICAFLSAADISFHWTGPKREVLERQRTSGKSRLGLRGAWSSMVTSIADERRRAGEGIPQRCGRRSPWTERRLRSSGRRLFGFFGGAVP